jgi:hypothetical protein
MTVYSQGIKGLIFIAAITDLAIGLPLFMFFEFSLMVATLLPETCSCF